MKIKRMIWALLFSVISSLCITPLVSAASDYDNLHPDNETGWAFNSYKSHRGSKNNYYAYDSTYTKSLYSSSFESAVSSWSTYINMTETTSSNYGIINTENDTSTNAVATVLMPSHGATTGHYSDSFTITINRANFDNKTSELKRKALIHEIGHVYGLSHFIDETAPKIMHPILTNSMSIRTSDLRGLIVCTHSHTHSSYTYELYDFWEHKKRCSVCKAYIYEEHTFDMNGICYQCGYHN